MSRAAWLDLEGTCDLVRAEYLEMPGLSLTHPQIQRLWNLDASSCDAVLSQLIAEGFLRRADQDEYVLAPRQESSQEFASARAHG